MPLVLAGCADPGDGSEPAGAQGNRVAGINLAPEQHRVRGTKDARAAALVPARVRESGTLRIGITADGIPPLGFYATDDRTVIGVETDIAVLVADTLGLKAEFEPLSWENLFVGLDSGKLDAGFSNITVTEDRKEKYDFATYRLDELAVETRKGSGWRVKGPRDVAGKSIAVSTGTNQEKILVDWAEENRAAGRAPVDIKYFQKESDTYLALRSGRIDGYFGPHPSVAYHVATTGETEIAGRFSGGGEGLQGKIAATTKKGSGLARAYAAALQRTIADGTYQKVLKRWKLSSEAVKTSEVNPPGLPRTAS
ncbi:ABC transporter substrate-binding protein [Streptomyces sp. NPDC003077]|uniref:ABC transporter substrate-binding protein n=1 Tax=Streptomyces sp. NPDC003077 TaxID=3154443 RepID=UPI00339EAD71